MWRNRESERKIKKRIQEDKESKSELKKMPRQNVTVWFK